MASKNTSPNTASVSSWRPTRREPSKTDFQYENSLDFNGVSVCIRFAFKNITPQRVFACLKKTNIEFEGRKTQVFLGMIERIDQVIRKDGNKMFFVHFSANSWSKTDAAKFALQQLCDGELRVYYDEPYFWKLSISKSRRPRDEDRRRVLVAPRMIGSPPWPPAELSLSEEEEFSSAAALATGNELTYEDDAPLEVVSVESGLWRDGALVEGHALARPVEDEANDIADEVRDEIKSHSDTSGEAVEMDDAFA